MLALIVGAAVGGATYLLAKKKRASTGQSVAAGAVSGVASWGATAVTLALVSTLWPVLLVGGVAGGVYYLGKKKTTQKALPPAS